MKTHIIFAALSLLVAGSSARAAGPMDPAGTWLTEDGRAKVRIEKCGADHAEICGNVVWLKEPLDDNGHPKTDEKNPDPAKRSRSTLGMPLFVELKPDDEQVYSGEIYNAENGKNYDVTFKVDKANDIKVKGCVLAVLCGSQHWSRVADLPSTVVAQGKTKVKSVPAE